MTYTTINLHRAINAALLAAWLLLIAFMQTLDADPDQALADDAAQAPKTALAQHQHHVATCRRVHGPNTEPAENADGQLLCIDRQGRTATPLLLAQGATQ